MSSRSFFSCSEEDDDIVDPLIVVGDVDVLDIITHETFKLRLEGLNEMRECAFRERQPSEGVFIQLPSLIGDAIKIRYIYFDAALLKGKTLPETVFASSQL